jgi:plastocyanin
MRQLSWRASLVMLVLTGTGCGGGDGPIDPPPPDPALTTVDVTPDATTLFTVAPGTSVRLTATPKDQDGQRMDGLAAAVFTSGNEAIATVDAEGVVTAVGVGTAQITASVTDGDNTKAGEADVTVQVASDEAGVTAPEFAYLPETVDVAAGGTVTWTVGGIHHTVTFNTAGSPASIPEMLNQSVPRTFPGSGTYRYHCEIHPSMTGTVRVH